MIEFKIYVPISNKMAIAVEQTHKSCLFAGEGQQAALSPICFALPMRLLAPY